MTAFTVVRGAPNDEELAVLAAVLLRRARPSARRVPPPSPARWSRSGAYAPPGAWTSR